MKEQARSFLQPSKRGQKKLPSTSEDLIGSIRFANIWKTAIKMNVHENDILNSYSHDYISTFGNFSF